MRDFFKYTLGLYILLSVLMMGFVLAILLLPEASFETFVTKRPGVNTDPLVASVLLIWLLVGIVLLLGVLGKINSKNALMIACGTAVCLLYLTILSDINILTVYEFRT